MLLTEFLYTDKQTGETVKYHLGWFSYPETEGWLIPHTEFGKDPSVIARAYKAIQVIFPIWQKRVEAEELLHLSPTDTWARHSSRLKDSGQLPHFVEVLSFCRNIPSVLDGVEIPEKLRLDPKEDEYYRIHISNANRSLEYRRQALERKQAREEAKRKPPKSGYLYVIKALLPEPCYKIGLSKVLEQRIETLEVKLPFPIEPLHFIQTDDMRRSEAFLHGKFAHKRQRGEWFRLEQSDLDYLLSLQQLNAEDC